jgi:hypothetical protein
MLAAAGTVAAILVSGARPGGAGDRAGGSGICRVREILAAHGSEHIDDRLSGLTARLASPPLSAWQHFDLMSDQRMTVTDGTGRAELSHRTELTVHRGRARVRNDLGASVLALPLRLDDPRPQLFGGQRFDDGTQLIVVDCAQHQ